MCLTTFSPTAKTHRPRSETCSDARSLFAGYQYGQLHHQRQYSAGAETPGDSADGPGGDIRRHRGGAAFWSHPQALGDSAEDRSRRISASSGSSASVTTDIAT